MTGLLAPSGREDVRRVRAHPEIVAFGIAVEMKAEPVAPDLHDRQDAEERRVLGVNAL